MRRGVKSIEFFLAIVIAIFLVISLLSQQLLNLPPQLTSFLIFSFILVKLIDIVKSGGSIFEDYISLGLILMFGIINFFLSEQINSVLITVAVFILIYSVGMIPWINNIINSKRVTSFILSYGFFILMIIFLFAGAYSANSHDFEIYGKKTTISFEDALYFSTITFTTVGYGELTPTGYNKLISSIQAITGMVLNIAFVGYILASSRFRTR